MCTYPPLFSAMLLYMACKSILSVLSTVAELCMHAAIKRQCGFYKADVWQRVSGLCPDPLGSPREGREERRTEGGREAETVQDRTIVTMAD